MHRPSPQLALLALFAGLVSSSASAEVICANTGLSIAADGEGLYVNLITGASARAESGAPGFDIDIYASQASSPANQLKFYWGSASLSGAGVVSSGSHYAALGTNVIIDGTLTFSRDGFAGDTSEWQAGIVGYLGMRFRNEGTGITNYGWLRLSTTAPLGFPASIHGWCYENSGTGIGTPGVAAEAIFADAFELPPER